MLTLPSTPIPNMECQFAGKSLIRTENSIRFRQQRTVAISSSAFTSPTKNSDATSLSLKLAPMSFYEVLGISKEATGEEIKSAYRRQAMIFHPDVVTAADQKSASADEFIKIHAAYSTLSDPDKRADYDRRNFSRRRSYVSYSTTESPTVTRYSGYSGRNWETDQCW